MTEMVCTTCKETKLVSEMRKQGKQGLSKQCNDCCNKVKKARLLKLIEFREMKVQKPVSEYVPKRTFEFQPYTPEKVYVRNNGNVHIKSRGFQC